MSHHRNAVVGQSPNHLEDGMPAFELHRRCAAFLQQPSGIAYRFSGTDLIRQEGHVGNNQGAAGATTHRSRVVDHHVERDRNGAFEAEHHHSHGIADENNINSGAIEQSRHRGIVGRQNRNLRACRLHRPKIGDSNRLHGYREYRKNQKTE